MPKIGPTFSDFVFEEKVKRRRGGGDSLPSTYIGFIPLLILSVTVIFLATRLFYLQILRGNYYGNLADKNRVRTKIVGAPRGIITDRNGKPLVANSPAFKIMENGKVKWLDKNTALEMLSKGKDVQNDIRRDYLYKDALAHVLGYVGQISPDEIILPDFADYTPMDFVGKTGIEKKYEVLLHGRNGKELFEVDSKEKLIRSLGKQEEEPGQDLKTSLDVNLQLSAAKAFSDVKKGAVVASDPNSGEILALYSKPSFDPNLFTHPANYEASGDYKSLESILSDNTSQPVMDRVISGTYPPGSTFKLVTATAALSSGAIDRDTLIEDTGVLKVGDFSYGNWYFSSYGRTEGKINVVAALKRSNDIFFYKAAEETGADVLASWSKKFGLGNILGIDLPGESKGVVPNNAWKKDVVGEMWYLGDTYHFGIGQGYLLTTPLQVNFWTQVFANNGTLYKPNLMFGKKEILRKNFIKQENIDLVRTGMKEACEQGGVAWPFFDFKVKNDSLRLDGDDFTEEASGGAKFVKIRVGCKTGTAETTTSTDPHAWITVFAPFKNPEIVLTVLVENGGEGSNVAAPIAKKILEDYFTRKK